MFCSPLNQRERASSARLYFKNPLLSFSRQQHLHSIFTRRYTCLSHNLIACVEFPEHCLPLSRYSANSTAFSCHLKPPFHHHASIAIMYVWKRGKLHHIQYSKAISNEYVDGRKERVQFDKITARVSRLCYGLDAEHVDAAAITQKVISGVYQGVTTIELDNLVRLIISNALERVLTYSYYSLRPQRLLHT